MKFIIGSPRYEEETLDDRWQEIKNLNNRKSLIISGIILGFCIAIPLFEFLSYFLFSSNLEIKFYVKCLIISALIPLHELLHLIFFPKIKDTTIGVSFKYLIFYVTTKREISKLRLLIIGIFPFFIFSVVPLIALFFYSSEVLLYVFFYNTIGSGVDLITFFYVSKIPSKSYVKFTSKKIYYR